MLGHSKAPPCPSNPLPFTIPLQTWLLAPWPPPHHGFLVWHAKHARRARPTAMRLCGACLSHARPLLLAANKVHCGPTFGVAPLPMFCHPMSCPLLIACWRTSARLGSHCFRAPLRVVKSQELDTSASFVGQRQSSSRPLGSDAMAGGHRHLEKIGPVRQGRHVGRMDLGPLTVARKESNQRGNQVGGCTAHVSMEVCWARPANQAASGESSVMEGAHGRWRSGVWGRDQRPSKFPPSADNLHECVVPRRLQARQDGGARVTQISTGRRRQRRHRGRAGDLQAGAGARGLGARAGAAGRGGRALRDGPGQRGANVRRDGDCRGRGAGCC